MVEMEVRIHDVADVAGPEAQGRKLANDAIVACAPEVASDFAAYVKERSRR